MSKSTVYCLIACAAVLFMSAAPPALAASKQPGATDFSLRPRLDGQIDAQTLLNRAERGDARAAYLLGTRFGSGRDGVRDDSEAFKWFRKAADLGLEEAQYNLGILFSTGRGVARDPVEAARWFTSAAEQGMAEAQFNLGTLYGLGLGVPRSDALAAKWLTAAADDALPQAQFNLGVLYEHGRGVRLDGRAALVWYERAAKQGFEPAQKRLDALRSKLRLDGKSLDPLAAQPTKAKPTPAKTGTPRALAPPTSAAARARAAVARASAVAHSKPAEPRSLATARPKLISNAFIAWVKALNPDHFTLQLLSDTDEASVRRYIQRNLPPGQAGYFVTRQGGKTLYPVVYGSFATRTEATTAIERLPAKLKRGKPWIRKVGIIFKSMQ